MRSQYRVLFAFIILLVAISCLCTSTDVTPSTPPTNPPVLQPTQPQPPTQEQQQLPSAEAPLPQDQQFFTEEFDSPLTSAWSILTVTGSDKANPDKVTVEPKNGKLVWDFDSEEVYYHLFYEGFSYTDVTVEVNADNRGVNNNSISLICRYDPEVGWYDFNIANNGLYAIYYVEVMSDGLINYIAITNGGSNNIKQGKAVNEYSITCKGDKLSLTINGKDINTVSEKKYGLREGGVGVSVKAFNLLPVLVEMDWFKISEP